jgi:hypothetical protein
MANPKPSWPTNEAVRTDAHAIAHDRTGGDGGAARDLRLAANDSAGLDGCAVVDPGRGMNEPFLAACIARIGGDGTKRVCIEEPQGEGECTIGRLGLEHRGACRNTFCKCRRHETAARPGLGELVEVFGIVEEGKMLRAGNAERFDVLDIGRHVRKRPELCTELGRDDIQRKWTRSLKKARVLHSFPLLASRRRSR